VVSGSAAAPSPTPPTALFLCATVLRQHNTQNLLWCWVAPEFGLRRRGHSPLLMALGRGGNRAWSWAQPPVTPGPVPPVGAGSPLLAACNLLLNVKRKETRMHWTTPTLVEICIGLEINGYLPAEF
jgi:coenzyme PQQ precursor peptide PqqA